MVGPCRAGPKARAVLGWTTVPSHRPRHGPTAGLCQHGPDNDRTVLYLGWAKIMCRGLGRRASGLMANYNYEACG
uniref:Uncharacterized protein n=1 Tax=Oryza sativa subsp. japonica TaxID=39947 RepID=Q69ML4_ORYSJ|nr:hypothetical protein [Oryza sativa Japonica Group]